MRFRFLTSTARNIARGSGTYVGISVLANALRELGHTVDFESPTRHFPVFTVERLWFNLELRASAEYDCTVGFDMDGYQVARGAPGSPHVASLKGVIADEVRFERGLTRLTMSVQARCERLHVHRAARVLVTSRYSGECAQRLYGLDQFPTVVPELIDLTAWRRRLEAFPAPAHAERFTVLYVGRFYRRKRVGLLLEAAAELRGEIPNLEVRVVGNGPCGDAWRAQAGHLQLGDTVTWLGDVSRADLAAEYNRADVFCLPSVQEGFGIVLLEAMAAGKPIVAARAAAIPEVAPHATLVEPESAAALAAGILALYGSTEARAAQAAEGLVRVARFDAALVAKLFVEAVRAAF
ncbi:MAG: glycosyltransferase family 4 protein [Candidatus Solibacter sp.]|nr:glycosyltransferase family 4 protein [Candidatus Solibacter sp.]